MRVQHRAVRTAAAATIAVAAVSAATAGAASAATLAVNARCYVTSKAGRPPMAVSGTGYTPGDDISISDKTGGLDTTTTADASGDIAVTAKAPVPLGLTKPGQKADTITATDFPATGGQIVGTTTTELSVLAAEPGKTHKARGLRVFGEKTTWSFSGFPVGRKIWGHYTFAGKLIGGQAFGRAKAPCGTLKSRKIVLPATPHHRGYDLQVDSHKKYSKKTKPHVKITLRLITF
jgi:hypothetical protein